MLSTRRDTPCYSHNPGCPECPPAECPQCRQPHPWLSPLLPGGGLAHAPAIYGFNFHSTMLQETLRSPDGCPTLEGDSERDIRGHRGVRPGDQHRQNRSPVRGHSRDRQSGAAAAARST